MKILWSFGKLRQTFSVNFGKITTGVLRAKTRIRASSASIHNFQTMSDSGNNLRRSTRVRTKVRDYSDNEDSLTPVKNNSSRRRNNSTSSVEDEPVDSALFNPELEKELETIEEDTQRPTELFTTDDVSANRYYGFQTPGRKGKKMIINRTPAKPVSPEKLPELKIVLNKAEAESPEAKTTNVPVPRRRRIVTGLTSSEDESVSEDSEFVPSDDDDEEESADDDIEDEIAENDEENSEDESTKGGRVNQVKKVQMPATPSTKRGASKKTVGHSDFHLKTDEYFMSQSAKILTSDRTLARLKNPRLNEEKLQELLSNMSHVSRTHSQALCRLTENYRSSFHLWYHVMEEGYSLLLHGLGSKRELINNFHSEIIADHPTLIVNGFFPSLSAKDILDGIIIELLGEESPTNFNECFNLIEETLRKNPDDRLYLLIHNIGATMLRSNKSQDTLSRLAAIPNVRLLASVDHINAPLIWDNVKRSRFNFYWFDATTFMPYEAETSYESSLLVQHSGALALSSLHNVFQSLTTNTKAIYILLVKHQLEHGKNQHYPGMAFKDLYRGAREGFLVSSDLALRAQLTEFIDHKLVRTKRNVDGAEYLIIPLNNDLLQQFIDQQDEP